MRFGTSVKYWVFLEVPRFVCVWLLRAGPSILGANQIPFGRVMLVNVVTPPGRTSTVRKSVTFATDKHTARELYTGNVQFAVEQIGETGSMVTFGVVHMPSTNANFVD
jgi:hypothetical protein